MRGLMMKNPIKILVLGDKKVGKTSLVRKYIGKGFRKKYIDTLRIELSNHVYTYEMKNYSKKYEKSEDTHEFELQIMDAASGQITDLLQKGRMFSGNVGICFVFDVNRLDSYLNLSHLLIQINEKYPKMRMPILLVGNRAEGARDQTLSDEDIKQYVQTIKDDKRIRSKFIDYRIISVKNDKNVSSIFEILANEIIKNIHFKRGKFRF